MKKKNGFTLLEIIVVVMILGVLLLFIMPKVLDRFAEGRKATFKNQVRSVMKSATEKRMVDLAYDRASNVYCSDESLFNGCSIIETDSDGADFIVILNNDGKIISAGVKNSAYCYVGNDIDAINLNDVVADGELTCNRYGCTCDGTEPLAPQYVYSLDDSQYYYQTEMPLNTVISIEELDLNQYSVFTRTKIDSQGNAVHHDSCLYYNGNYICIGPDDLEQSDIQSRLSSEFINIFGSSSAQCKTSEMDGSYSCAYIDGDYMLAIGYYANQYASRVLLKSDGKGIGCGYNVLSSAPNKYLCTSTAVVDSPQGPR